MKCLYCGGPLPLALLKKLTGAGEFCSENCRQGYQSEFNRLAVGRLQQARVTRRVLPVGELQLPAVEQAALEMVPIGAAGSAQRNLGQSGPVAGDPAAGGVAFGGPAPSPPTSPAPNQSLTQELIPEVYSGPGPQVSPEVGSQVSHRPGSEFIPEPIPALISTLSSAQSPGLSQTSMPTWDAVPPPVWVQSAVPPMQPAAVAELEPELAWRHEVPERMFLELPDTLLPVRPSRPEAPAPNPAPVEELFAALQSVVAETAEPQADEFAVAGGSREDVEGSEAGWMAPRGMKALSLSAVRGPVGLQSGPLVPAPIYVYLQLPEALISGALGSTGLWWAGAAGGPEPEATGASDALYDTAFPLQEGLRQTLRADRPYRIPLALSPSATFRGDQADLRFSPGAAPLPAMLPNVHFVAARPTWAGSVRVDLTAQDERFDPFLRPGQQAETRERLQKVMARKAAQRALMAGGPTVTLPVEAVQPALNLLASVSSTILARHMQGDGAMGSPGHPPRLDEIMPRLADNLAALMEAPRPGGPALLSWSPVAESPGTAGFVAPGSGAAGSGFGAAGSGWPGSGLAGPAPTSAGPDSSVAGGPGFGSLHSGSAGGTAPVGTAPVGTTPLGTAPGGTATGSGAPGLGSAGAGLPGMGGSSESQSGLPAGPLANAFGPAALTAPPVSADGRPSGWPENVPYPPPGEVPAKSAPPALAEPPAGGGGGAALPGMPPISGNVYMFGNEINAKDEDTSKALVKPGAELLEPEPELDQPNFTRPAGFPLSGGGTMNVGTMVVVNQPSGTVNINAASPTAATFESRLRQKGPAPLSSIAEAVGTQLPVPLSPKDLPLRMNFQGRLEAALPVKWPDLPALALRKKMFLAAPGKARRPDGSEGYAPVQRPLGGGVGGVGGSGVGGSGVGGSGVGGGNGGGPGSMPHRPAGTGAGSGGSAPDQGEDKSGAVGWIKSFSSRFGKK